MGFMELFAIVAVSVIVALLNSLHVIVQWIQNKPGELFTGIAHSFADYFLYAAQMAQGAAGRWIFSDHLFTNEPLTPTWYYWFNVTLGHIGGIAGLSPFATYNTSLILLVVMLCLVWYFLTKTLYPTNRFLRLTTWLMILTATSSFSLARSPLAKLGVLQVELLGQFWFSPAPVFNRLGGVPYQVFQTILFVLLAIVFANMLRSSFKYNLLRITSLVSLIALLSGSANPVQMVLFVAVASVTTVYVFTRRNHIKVSKHQHIVALGAVAVAGAFGAWMTTQEFARQAVFVAARAWEQSQYVPNNLPVLLTSIGPIILFVPFGIRRAFKRGETLRLLFVLWGLLSFLFFLSPIPRLFQISPVRFLHPVPYASLAIIGSEGLIALSILLTRSVRKRISLFTIRAFLIALYLVFTVPSISRQLIDRTTPERNPQLLLNTIYNHVPASIVEALDWLKKHHQPGVVLSDPAIPIEVLVPVFTGKPSFSGHPIHTLYPDVKEARRQEFFAGKMRDPARFLSDHRIGYIIAAAHRQLPASASALLVETYRNVALAIYRYSGN